MAQLPAGVDDVIFGDLERTYRDRKLVVFAGAGVSAGAGLPMWKPLAEALVDRMRQMNKPADAVEEAADLVAQNNLVTAMSAARSSLGLHFDRLVKSKLDDDGHAVPPVAAAIAALAPRLAGVVTTNLDRFLERAFVGAWPVLVDPIADLLQRPRYIFKPHGTIDNAATWVFTREEYDHVMFGSRALQDLFAALYRARTLLFVGASLTDDDFGLTLGAVRALAGRDPPTHYAILPGSIGPARRDLLEKAGILPLVYRNDSGDHREVVHILQALAGQSPAISPPRAQNVPVAPAQNVPVAPAPTVAPKARKLVEVFLSAHPADKALRDRLVTLLQPLIDTGSIRIRHEGDVLPGATTRATIDGFIDAARVVLLLVSADYCASGEHHLQADRARARGSAVEVIPVIARPCLWERMPFHAKRPLPEDGRPITGRANIDDALLEVVRGLQKILDALP